MTPPARPPLRLTLPPLAAALLLAGGAGAEVIGRYTPSAAVDEARLAALPPGEQKPWRAYLRRSREMMARDKAVLAAERAGRPVPPQVAKGPSGGAGMPLDRPAEWYGSPAALRVAENILSFQTPSGGWGKNQDRDAPPRRPGQMWTAADVPWAARDIEGDPNWAFVGTIDNNATTQELRFLARVQGQRPGCEGERYRQSFLKGVRYLLVAQYPNGGWPQAFPLMGGYHDAATFNDAAAPKVLDLLSTVARRQGDYAFVPAPLARQAGAAAERGYRMVLAAQVVAGGRRTAWGQQHDPLTLRPTGARKWEPAALSTDESADTVEVLTRAPRPSPELSQAIEAACSWLRDQAVYGLAWTKTADGGDRRLVAAPGAGPIWPRMVDIASGRPAFGDHEGLVHDRVEALPAELRAGYSWYVTGPAKALAACDAWRSRRLGGR